MKVGEEYENRQRSQEDKDERIELENERRRNKMREMQND